MIYQEELEFIRQHPDKKFKIKWFYDRGGTDVETMEGTFLKISQPRCHHPSFPPQPFYIHAFDSNGVKLETFVNASSLGKGGSGFKMLLSVEPIQEEMAS
jgi:hypothetical protein